MARVRLDLQIRPSDAEDLPVIERALGVNDGHFYRERLGRRGAVLTAWQHGEAVGAVWASLEPADEWVVRLLLREVPLLYRLRVREECRRQGIGTRLVSEAEGFLRRAGRLRVAVGVDRNNQGVKDFYQTLGYRLWGLGWPVPTFEETYTSDGQLLRRRDRCRMLVKNLRSHQ